MLRLLCVSLGCVAALSPQPCTPQVKKGIHVNSWPHQAAQRVAPALLAGILSATAVPALAAEPSPAALQIVQQALESSSAQKSDAVPLLDKAINTWKKEKLPDDELAGLYRLRADARNRLGAPDKAEADLSEVVRLLRGPGAAAADPAELPRALLFRARLEFARSAWSAAREDASAALALDDSLENLEQKNPFTYELLGRAALRDGDFAAAAAAFGSAEKAHDRVGDAIRARNAGADRALALLGAGDDAGSTESRRIFAQKSNPRTNNPDDIPLLQELSRKDAELHLALGAKLAAKGDGKDANALWETGCIRLRTYVDDATARIVADDVRGSARIKLFGASLLDGVGVRFFDTPDSPLICAQAKTDNLAKDPAAAARGLAAFSVGLDPKNPYVTQQTNTQFLWYELDVESNLYR
jgi:tetratricopeptide (TPR) repeat protein